MEGKDYWRRVPDPHHLNSAIQHIIRQLSLFRISDDVAVTAADRVIKARVVHSSDNDFLTLLDELIFSGQRLEDWSGWQTRFVGF
ncbi:hypothetical protein [Paenibacillus sp. UNC496MF]|uniref:hypothetical protein n=1 Tax=Paenibacillus sp. UNC496MF TaxID=1502753 RepID=UPI001160CCF0|nr:hypothetical protein [Paenibacillus sp. UNC496MF]